MMPARLDPDEIDYLIDFMSKKPEGSTMVEWGSGGSTTMFLPFFTTGSFTSIEHNREWYDKVREEVYTKGDYAPAALNNFTYLYVPPIIDIRFYGYGVPYEENPCYARDYISPKTPKDIFNSDIFFVDGICRGAILATIRMKATKLLREYDCDTGQWSQPATVFIHDYFGPEQREPWYEWASSLYGKVEKVGSTLARLYI